MPEWSQGLILTQNVDWGFLLSTTFLRVGLLLGPITYKCLLKVLCPVSRSITTADCVLLKDNNRALVARLGSEIKSQACLCVLQGLRHNTRRWFSIQYFIFLLVFCLETTNKGSGPTNLWTEPSLASISAISFPRTPAACPGTQYSPAARRAEMSFNVFWHCRDSYIKKSCNNYSKKTFCATFQKFCRPGDQAPEICVPRSQQTRQLVRREEYYWIVKWGTETDRQKMCNFFEGNCVSFSAEFQCDSDNTGWGKIPSLLSVGRVLNVHNFRSTKFQQPCTSFFLY